jgi:hypothetical protein
VTFKNADHFEDVADVREEDHIALEGKAADVGTQFRPCPAEHSRQARQTMAFVAKLGRETLTGFETSADLAMYSRISTRPVSTDVRNRARRTQKPSLASEALFCAGAASRRAS